MVLIRFISKRSRFLVIWPLLMHVIIYQFVSELAQKLITSFVITCLMAQVAVLGEVTSLNGLEMAQGVSVTWDQVRAMQSRGLIAVGVVVTSAV